MSFAVGVGAAQPAMLLAFRSLFSQLGSTSVVSGALISNERMNDLLFILGGIGCFLFVADFIAVSGVTYITASTMVQYKRAYLKAVLRQDVGWYDVSHPEELTTQFAGAMVKVQKGFKSLPMCFMGLGYGFGGLIIAAGCTGRRITTSSGSGSSGSSGSSG